LEEIGMAPDDDYPVEVYRREVANVLPLTKEEAAYLFQEARQSGDPGEPAKRRLIESHLHLVLLVAERYASSGVSTLDLIREGNLGLMRALERYPGADLDDFSAYAASSIESFISEATARSKSH
jgi:DNA-directed RNA polymerase sigma subunit (sigma70/sigma32)